MRRELGREPAHLPKRPSNQFAEASPAPCGSVADQRGKHEINGRRQFDPGPVGRPGSAAAGISVRHVLKEGSNNGAAPRGPLTNINSRSEGFRYLRTGYLAGKPLGG